MLLGLIIVFIGKVFNKKISLRKFGVEALNVYVDCKGIKKRILKFIFMNMDVLFYEINTNCFCFPNVGNRIIESDLQTK